MNLIFEIEKLSNDELKTLLLEIKNTDYINKYNNTNLVLNNLLKISIQKEFKDKIYDIKKIIEKEVIIRFINNKI